MKGRDRAKQNQTVKRIHPYNGGKEMTFDKIHRSCMDKTRFHSRKTVKRVAKEYGLRYYRCEFCGEWHLTSKKYKGSIKP